MHLLHRLGTVLLRQEVHQAIDTAARHREEVDMVVDAEQGQKTTHTFHVRPIPDQGHQLPDVEAEIDHIHTRDHHPERLCGEEEEEEEEVHRLEVRRDEEEGAQAIAPIAAIVEVAVELEADLGAGEATGGEDEGSLGRKALYCTSIGHERRLAAECPGGQFQQLDCGLVMQSDEN